MRIVILGKYGIDVGGVARYNTNLVDSLKKNQHLDIHVVTLKKEIDKNIITNNHNLTIYQLKSLNLPWTFTGLTTDVYTMVKVVDKIGPDIVHGFEVGYPYGLATALLSKKYPTILTPHGIFHKELRSQTLSLKSLIFFTTQIPVEWYVFRAVHFFIGVSPYVVKIIKEYSNRSNIYMISEGVEKKYLNTAPIEKKGRILFVGGFDRRKGTDRIIKALKIVREKNKDAHLHIVGKIPFKQFHDEMQEFIEREKLSPHITYLGKVGDDTLLQEYASCSLFVMPSREESFGISLLEAMACGKPVVATKVGGIPYVVKNGITGFVVDENDIEGLAEKILLLLSNDRLRISMGIRAKERAKLFSWDEIAKKTCEVYEKVRCE